MERIKALEDAAKLVAALRCSLIDSRGPWEKLQRVYMHIQLASVEAMKSEFPEGGR